ncbi:flavin reductase [Roseibium salinum]|nr:flavin reductase [Roseibium salinum]
MDDRFAKGSWTRLATGCPALDNARLSVDCEVFSVTEMGTHSIIVGTVADLRVSAPRQIPALCAPGIQKASTRDLLRITFLFPLRQTWTDSSWPACATSSPTFPASRSAMPPTRS